MNELLKAINSLKTTEKVVDEYRLYYEDDIPYMLTTSKPDGNFITITHDQYLTMLLPRYKIKNGKLHNINQDESCILRLISNNDGQFCTLPNNMMFVANEGDRYSLKENLSEVGSSGK